MMICCGAYADDKKGEREELNSLFPPRKVVGLIIIEVGGAIDPS